MELETLPTTGSPPTLLCRIGFHGRFELHLCLVSSVCTFSKKTSNSLRLNLRALDHNFFIVAVKVRKIPSQQQKIPPHFFWGGRCCRGMTPAKPQTKLNQNIRLQRHDHDMTFVCHPSFSDCWVRPSDHPNPNHVVGRVPRIVPAKPETCGIPPQESPWEKALKMNGRKPTKDSHQLKSGKSSESHPPLFFWEVQNVKFPGFFWEGKTTNKKNSSAVWLAVSFRKGMRCNPSKTKTLANPNTHDGSILQQVGKDRPQSADAGGGNPSTRFPYTPRKFNSSPLKKSPSQKDSHLPNYHFSGANS